MDAPAPVVLVGGGHAAAAFVNSARRAGYEGPLLLISDEPVPPYHRPPLSKKYLAEGLPAEQILIRAAAWYDEQKVTLRLGTRVTDIDRAARRVVLADGGQVDYSQLVLLTGARPRRLPADIGGELPGVLVMRSLADADAMAPHLVAGRRLLVVGGGYIGLEAAAVAATKGLQVTLLEAAPRILQRVAAPATADFFRALHRSRGVDIREGVALRRLLAEGGRVCGAELGDGRRIEADVVLVGIGVQANVELAESAGLAIDNGIAVDEFCRSSDPAILAAGDCCSFPFRGRRIRLESVQNANDQAAAAAHTLAGKAMAYAALPWFWSDQYDTKLQIAGLNQGYDEAIPRPGKTERSLSVWYYQGDSLLAVDAINDAAAYVTAKKLLERGAGVPKAAVRDPAAQFKDWLA
ncbi:MAG: FAD-dependent oxidoreductase [Burkholderiaceae bacterium]|nr:FAD-dependent oxidoreductase [Burkholderiaceae bacterium]